MVMQNSLYSYHYKLVAHFIIIQYKSARWWADVMVNTSEFEQRFSGSNPSPGTLDFLSEKLVIQSEHLDSLTNWPVSELQLELGFSAQSSQAANRLDTLCTLQPSWRAKFKG